MTTGYLWTGQYPECKSVAEEGKPHSMELDEETLDGQWSKNYKTNMDFFIINDAIFSKLCILGDDVEPCFEGSSITPPDISASFTKVDDKFTQTLFTMMQELKFALKGEQDMAVQQIDSAQDKFEKDLTVKNENVTEASEETEFVCKEEDEDKKDKTKCAKCEDDDEEKDKSKCAKNACGGGSGSASGSGKKKEDDEDNDDESSDNKDDDKEDEEEKKKYSLLKEEYDALETKFSNLESQYQELLQFKNQIEDEKKDALIKSFYMLSDEDKKKLLKIKQNIL